VTGPAGVELAASEVRAAAASARDWHALAAAARTCTACPELAATRHRVVVGAVPPRGARLLLVGEAPGTDEDASGLPFVGKAGQLLDRVLGEVGLDRAEVAVANTLKCRPPGNRLPARAELARCRGWLERQVELVRPALVVSLGLTATRWWLGRSVALGAARGRVHDVEGQAVLPTYHPSAAIRFGPRGEPLALLRADLALAAQVVA
jgi:uracil-DNA glycosylase family 4